MAVFSIIKRGREQAKEHNAKQAEKAKAEAVKAPYKHVPTHAAVDALSGAPSGWKHDYRPRIMEQNRRRSEMMIRGLGSDGLPRVGSSLSNLSHPSVYGTPIVPLPKNYSFSSIPASWNGRLEGSASGFATPTSPADYFSHGSSTRRGKDPESAPLYLSSGGGFVAYSGQNTAMSSKAGSRRGSSSEVELEIRSTRHSMVALTPDATVSEDGSAISLKIPSEGDNSHRLHPGYQRRSHTPHNKSVDRTYPPTSRSAHFKAPQPMDPMAMNNTASSSPGLPRSSPLASSTNQPGVPFIKDHEDDVPSGSLGSSLHLSTQIAPQRASAPISSASSAQSAGTGSDTTPSSLSSTPEPDAIAPIPATSAEKETFTTTAVEVTSKPNLNKTERLPKMFSKHPSRSLGPNIVDHSSTSSGHSVEVEKPTAAATADFIRQLDAMDQPTVEPTPEKMPKGHKRLSKKSDVKTAATPVVKAKKRWSFRTSKSPAAVAV